MRHDTVQLENGLFLMDNYDVRVSESLCEITEQWEWNTDWYTLGNRCQRVSSFALSYGWSAIGIMTDPMNEARTFDDGSDPTNSHICHRATDQTNLGIIRTELDRIGTNLYLIHDNMVFYDAGHEGARDYVQSVERTLADYPRLDDADTDCHERDLGAEEFRRTLTTVDLGEIDEDEVVDTWADLEHTHCYGCGWSVDADDVRGELGYEKCSDCDAWFDPDAADTSADRCAMCVEVDAA